MSCDSWAHLLPQIVEPFSGFLCQVCVLQWHYWWEECRRCCAGPDDVKQTLELKMHLLAIANVTHGLAESLLFGVNFPQQISSMGKKRNIDL